MGSILGGAKMPEKSDAEKEAEANLKNQRLDQEDEIARRRAKSSGGRGSLLTGSQSGVTNKLG